MSKKTAVVDGANIAYIEKSQKGDPKVTNILAVSSALEKKGFEPLVIVDASLIYKIDDRTQLEVLIRNQAVRQAPAGTDADYFIIQTAEKLHAIVVSNDEYQPYIQEHPRFKKRRVPVMILQGRAEPYEPELE
jgi:hypothetical protein